MSGTDDPRHDALFTHHPDLTDAKWARMSQRAKRRHIRKAWRGQSGTPRRRVSAGGIATSVVVVAIASTLIVLSWHPWSTVGANATDNPSFTDVPTMTPTVRQNALDLTHPFTDTPAAGWADGAAGIQPPPATPTGPYGTAQVADAMNTVKQALIAAHLDNRMLVDHDTSGYLAFFAPNARGDEGKHLTGPNGDGEVTSLAPGFRLLPVPIKVHGTISASADPKGYLVVHTNYVFAYPFAPGNPLTTTDASQIVAIVHTEADFYVLAGAARADQGLWNAGVQAYTANIACKAANQGLLAPAYSDTQGGGDSTEDPGRLYDPNHPLDIKSDCRPNS